jgi:hypothetical protein
VLKINNIPELTFDIEGHAVLEIICGCHSREDYRLDRKFD